MIEEERIHMARAKMSVRIDEELVKWVDVGACSYHPFVVFQVNPCKH